MEHIICENMPNVRVRTTVGVDDVARSALSLEARNSYLFEVNITCEGYIVDKTTWMNHPTFPQVVLLVVGIPKSAVQTLSRHSLNHFLFAVRR